MISLVTPWIFGLFAIVLFGVVPAHLENARWQVRAPKTAILLWQLLGLIGCACVVITGLSLATIRFHTSLLSGLHDLFGDLTGTRPLAGIGLIDAIGLTLATDLAVVMTAMFWASVVRTLRAREHHRALVNLVSGRDARAPGIVKIPHPGVAAYCLPGLRPRIVMSDGAFNLLSLAELRSVITHERAHANQHHELVMFPLDPCRDVLRWIPYARRAPRAIRILLEMAADDHAARKNDPLSLATALVRMATSRSSVARFHTPRCVLCATDTVALRRVVRLLGDDRESRATCALGLFGALLCLVILVGLIVVM